MIRRLALDVEGDGQNPSNPVQIGISELDGFRPTGRHFVWMVKPPGPITFFASRVHDIRDADVAHLGPIDDVKDELARVLGSDAIVGHGVRGDYLSIKRVLPDWEPEAGYDTLNLAKTLRPGLASYRLKNIGDALGLSALAESAFSDGRPHDARFDALLAALIAAEVTKDLSLRGMKHALRQADIFNHKAGRSTLSARERRELAEAEAAAAQGSFGTGPSFGVPSSLRRP